jgi:hypothetical protein
MESTKEYLDRKEKFKILGGEDFEKKKDEAREMLSKYSLNGAYYGKNSPYGEGIKGSGDFGGCIGNLMVGHALDTFLKYDIPEAVCYGEILPFSYNSDTLETLGISSKYWLPKIAQGEGAFNNLLLSDEIRKEYKLTGIEKEDVLKIFQLGSKYLITRAERIVKPNYFYDHGKEENERLENAFKRVLNSDTTLGKEWQESLNFYNYIAEKAPQLREFESLEKEITDYILEKWTKMSLS